MHICLRSRPGITNEAIVKNIGSSFLTDMQQVRKGEPLVVGGKGAES